MPTKPTDFQECDTCRAKPGTPVLCAGCLHNRWLIGHQAKEIERLKEELRLANAVHAADEERYIKGTGTAKRPQGVVNAQGEPIVCCTACGGWHGQHKLGCKAGA